MQFVKKLLYNFIVLLLYAVALWGSVCIFKVLWGNDIWYDEIFSIVYSQNKISDMIMLTAGDVHPPFYYFYLKIVCEGLLSIFGKLSYIQAAKIASFLPLVGMWIISLTYFLRKYSALCSSLFIMLVTIMPQLCNYYVEIRMYSLCCLMITVCFCGMLLIFDAYKDDRYNIEGTMSKIILGYLLFSVFGILCAYTQYFACVGVIGLYITLFVFLIINRRKNGVIKGFIGIIVCALLSVVAYIPWLPSFFRQVSTVSGSYWIQPLTLRSIPGCIKFIYLPVSGDGSITYIAAGLMLIATGIIVIGFISCRPLVNELFAGFAGTISLSFVVFVGFILSIINKPIFVYRYMVPMLGVYYFGLAYMFVYLLKRRGRLFFVLLIPFVIGGKLTFNGFNFEENYKMNAIKTAIEELKSIPENSVIITNFDQVTCVIDYYRPDCRVLLYEGETDPAVQMMFEKDNQMLFDKDLVSLVSEEVLRGNDIFFLGSFNSREEIIADWLNRGITSNEPVSILLERYWVNIYQLGLLE